MVKDILSKKKIIINYLMKYPNIFTDLEKKQIINYIDSFGKYKFVPDTVREVYDELGIIQDDNNIYLGFIELIRNIYDIDDMKIVEVGGGVLPRLGKRLSDIISTGSITVYDPRLSVYESNNEKLRLVRENFSINTNISDADLLIGLMPCEACDVIVESALMYEKNFILALCEGGAHGEEFDYFEDEEEWQNSIIRQTKKEVEEKGMGKLKIKYLKEYGNPYPIIYNDKG